MNRGNCFHGFRRHFSHVNLAALQGPGRGYGRTQLLAQPTHKQTNRQTNKNVSLLVGSVFDALPLVGLLVYVWFPLVMGCSKEPSQAAAEPLPAPALPAKAKARIGRVEVASLNPELPTQKCGIH